MKKEKENEKNSDKTEESVEDVNRVKDKPESIFQKASENLEPGDMKKKQKE